MNVSELLSHLKDLDIKIWLEGDQLKVNAPKGSLTPELQSQIAANKSEIKHFLSTSQEASFAAFTPIVPSSADHEIPLSFAQQRLWFLNQYDPGNPAYTIVNVCEIKGPLDVQVLERSLSEILRRHSALRTIFSKNDNRQPIQVIQPAEPVLLAIIDLQSTPTEELEAEAHKRVTALAQEPFILTQGPLFRTTLFSLGPQRHWLVILIHHIVCDGWSTNVFLYELRTLYEAFAHGRPSPLQDLSLQYADYALWQRQDKVVESLRPQLDFWLETLKGKLPILEMPADYPRPALQTYHGANLRGVLSPDLLQQIRQLTSQHKVTPFMLLLAVFQILIYRYTGQDDVIIGTPQANRPQSELEWLIGLFVNTLTIRTDLSGNPTGMELLQRVRDASLQAFAHQDIPFEMIVEGLHPERDTSHSPVFQVFFTVQNVPEKTAFNEELEFTTITVDPKMAKFDLSLEIFVNQNQVFYNFEYNTDLFKAKTIQRMLGHYVTLLEGLCASPSLPIGQLPLLTAEERQLILLDWNDTHYDYPREQVLPALFEAQVQRTPQAVAICDEEGQITYSELDRRANQLARYLFALGVGPETLVGVSLPRSIDMVVSLLAILKAGGAYVPLDPGFPVDRLNYMLSDSAAPLLITHSNLAARFSGSTCQVICLNNESDQLASQSDQPLPLRSTPDNLAYVIYTSGSTGRPKGVQVLMRGFVKLFAFNASGTWLIFSRYPAFGHLPVFRYCRTRVVPAANLRCAVGNRYQCYSRGRAAFEKGTGEVWRYLFAGYTNHLAAVDFRWLERLSPI